MIEKFNRVSISVLCFSSSIYHWSTMSIELVGINVASFYLWDIEWRRKCERRLFWTCERRLETRSCISLMFYFVFLFMFFFLVLFIPNILQSIPSILFWAIAFSTSSCLISLLCSTKATEIRNLCTLIDSPVFYFIKILL